MRSLFLEKVKYKTKTIICVNKKEEMKYEILEK